MKKVILLLLRLPSCLYNISLAQQPGELDYNFAGGTVTTPSVPWSDIAAQPDGKILAVSLIIARYGTDGMLDSSFGSNGTVPIEVNDTVFFCEAVAIQPDGKILVAGAAVSENMDHDFLLVRYNADGSPDSTFDGDGVVRTDLSSGSDDYGHEIEIQADGKIVVGGESGPKLALSRYHSDGSLDSTFDYDGKMVISSINITTYGSIMCSYHEAYMELQTDGRILVGSTDSLARLNQDGSFDNSFGINGIASLPEWMNDLAVQPDGKIVLAGGCGCFKIVRLNANGSLDSSFAILGTATTCKLQSWDPDLTTTSIVLQPDGRILAGGHTVDGMLADYRNFALLRYNSNGFIDLSFGLDGRVITTIPGFQYESESHASAITPDMKVVLAGYGNMAPYGFLAKYHLGGMVWPADANSISGSNETFIIAPNPATSKLTITSGSKVKELTICNAIGQTTEYTAFSGSGTVTVDVGHLPPGIYYIKFTDETGSARTGKFLKQ